VLFRSNDADALYDECIPRGCTPNEQQRIETMDEDSATAGNMSTAGFVVGGVGVVGGITLLLLAPSDEGGGSTDSASGAIRPWVGVGSAGLSGTF